MFRYLLPAALLLTGGAALSADRGPAPLSPREQVRYDRLLNGLVAGTPQPCINPRDVTETARFGDRIVYSAGSRRRWVTDTGGGCFGLSRGDAIISRSTTGDYCRGDILQTVDLPSHTPSGSCSYGSFVPYTAPEPLGAISVTQGRCPAPRPKRPTARSG